MTNTLTDHHNVMNAKEYLLRYKLMTTKIETAERELADLREKSTAVAVNLDGMPHGSRLSDRTARLAAEIADSETALTDMRAQAERIRRDILRTLDKLSDPTDYKLLYLRYVRGYKWEAVAAELCYSYQWTSGHLHDHALESLQAVLDNT